MASQIEESEDAKTRCVNKAKTLQRKVRRGTRKDMRQDNDAPLPYLCIKLGIYAGKRDINRSEGAATAVDFKM